MLSDISMIEKDEEGKMAVACPLCVRRGKTSRVKLFQINYSEALVSCEDSQCPFPLLEGHLTSNIVRRDFRNMKDDVPVNELVSDNAKDGTGSSSQSEAATICDEGDESKEVSHTNVSDTPDTNAVINSASNSEVMNDKFPKFEFTASIPVPNDAKKKPKRKYYTGCRKRRNNKKASPGTQIVGIEPES